MWPILRVLDFWKSSIHWNPNKHTIWTDFPPLAEQKRIVVKVEALLALSDALAAGVVQAEEVRTRLLQAVLNGEGEHHG